MSAATWMQVWGDTMLTTALLVLAVLLIRKPFARHFGPRLAYSLWLIPALRLVLPPLPFADPVAVSDAQRRHGGRGRRTDDGSGDARMVVRRCHALCLCPVGDGHGGGARDGAVVASPLPRLGARRSGRA